MSSSNSLAAARRRRAAPPPQSRATQQQQRQRQPPPQQQQQQGGQPRAQPIRTTPMQALTSHEQRLNRMEAQFPQAINNINDNINVLTESFQTFQPARDFSPDIDELSNRVESLENMNKLREEEPEEDLEYFRNKVKSMGKQLLDVKTLLIKVQNFAMETNLTLLKYKNGMDAQLALQIQQNNKDAVNESNSSENTTNKNPVLVVEEEMVLEPNDHDGATSVDIGTTIREQVENVLQEQEQTQEQQEQ